MKTASRKKQAVVLIHGVGEQIPMDTLRGFVEAVWVSDTAIQEYPGPPGNRRPQMWSKPDKMSGDFELRRITTAENIDGRRTDFFEFYWAHLLDDTRLGHVWAWIKVLMLRRPSRVPRQLFGVWLALWIIAAATAATAILYSAGALDEYRGLKWIVGVGFPAVWIGIASILTKVGGDAARYLHLAPPNIASRKNIREAGTKLLEQLHTSNQYHRIILVGHSLGTVIGYDILTNLWVKMHDRHAETAPTPQPMAALTELQRLANEPTLDIAAFQEAQSDYLLEIQQQGNPWLVSDFVTCGSPLAHAVALMARDDKEFKRKIDERIFPICPPANEKESGFFWFGEKIRVPHHAAVFAPTRWTNLYFPCRLTIFGDVIGGRVQPAFERGVKDVEVRTTIWNGLFSHTFYWAFGKDVSHDQPPEHIVELRKAVRLCGFKRAKFPDEQTSAPPLASSPQLPAI